MRRALLVLMLGAASCRGCEESPLPDESPRAAISISPDVATRWEAVTIRVGTSGDARIALGGRASIAGLELEVVHFAPNFQQDAAGIRSDADAKNPAAHVRVREGDAVVFEGWVFPFEALREWGRPDRDLRLVAWHER